MTPCLDLGTHNGPRNTPAGLARVQLRVPCRPTALALNRVTPQRRGPLTRTSWLQASVACSAKPTEKGDPFSVSQNT